MSYWVVGAMWGGRDDQLETFVRRGYWFLGWSEEDEPAQNQLRDQIREGDRIAIKKMLGRGATDIEVRALGVVTEVDPEDHRVYVRWAISNLGRTVPSRGCFASIHGPFAADDEWTRLVFQL
jgi:hypothetical protein